MNNNFYMVDQIVVHLNRKSKIKYVVGKYGCGQKQDSNKHPKKLKANFPPIRLHQKFEWKLQCKSIIVNSEVKSVPNSKKWIDKILIKN